MAHILLCHNLALENSPLVTGKVKTIMRTKIAWDNRPQIYSPVDNLWQQGGKDINARSSRRMLSASKENGHVETVVLMSKVNTVKG